MRPSEAHALTWSSIKDKGERAVIVVNERVSFEGKKVEKGTKNGVNVRFFPINDDLANLIDRLPRIDNPNNLIFPDYVNKGYCPTQSHFGSIIRIFSEITNNLFDDNLISNPLTYYCTRNTFITELIRSGKVHIATLATLVGKSAKTILENYFASENNIVIPSIF